MHLQHRQLKCRLCIDSMTTIEFRFTAGPPNQGHAMDGAPIQPQGIEPMKKTLATLAVLSFAAAATSAFAGECPANKVGANPLTNAATMPKDVTDTVLSTVDLGPEINVPGRSLRLRKLVLQPGGIVPMHSHADRPALIMTASGTVTEYRSNCLVPIVHKAGDVANEAGGISHWWKNTGKTVAILYSSDVHHDAMGMHNDMK
jgi:quercetin dioxygenase-like cupin family protein